MTRREDPEERIKELSDASVPFNFVCHGLIDAPDAPNLEHFLHQKLNSLRLNKFNLRKEFFRTSLEVIEDTAKQVGYSLKKSNFKIIDDFALSKKKNKLQIAMVKEETE